MGIRGREENHPKPCSHGKRHDNHILKVQILQSINFVVIAQAPITVIFWVDHPRDFTSTWLPARLL